MAVFISMNGMALLLQRGGAEMQQHRVSNIFNPAASPAMSVYNIAGLTIAITTAIFIVVAGLILYSAIKYRRKPGHDYQEPPQIYGSNQIEVAWTIIPILIVFVLTGVTARIVAALENKKPGTATVEATVIGHQWWWEIRYPKLGISTANELDLPVAASDQNGATFLRLESIDVIHSFWVPQLSGKTDVIPNRTNHMWLDPRTPGTYYGNCAEYCGTQHANMLIRVVVHSQEDWKRWVANQQRNAGVPTQQAQAAGQAALVRVSANHVSANQSTASGAGQAGSDVGKDRALFESLSCVNCHTVRGTQAIGKFGPDLTHLMSRQTLASGMIDNTHQNLRAWINDPQKVKPGSNMPSMKLTDSELDQVVRYLETLQ